MTDANRHDKRLARSDDALLTVKSEVAPAGADDEALLLVGVYVLRDRAARDAAPVEADDVLASIFGAGCELDPLAGGGVGDRSESGRR